MFVGDRLAVSDVKGFLGGHPWQVVDGRNCEDGGEQESESAEHDKCFSFFFCQRLSIAKREDVLQSAKKF